MNVLGNQTISLTASISQCFMIKHCKKIEERDTLLFTILFNKKDKYHTASFLSFFVSRHDLRSYVGNIKNFTFFLCLSLAKQIKKRQCNFSHSKHVQFSGGKN